jgi:hypothetical protein
MRRDDEIRKELQFHIDERIADYLASGLSLEEARRRAAVDFGGITQTKEAVQDQNSWHMLDSLLRDVRFAVGSPAGQEPQLTEGPVSRCNATLDLRGRCTRWYTRRGN